MVELVDYIVKSGRVVSSRELNSVFNLDKNDKGGWPNTRARLKEGIRVSGASIGAKSTGYFQIKTIEELREYRKNLDARIDGIRERWILAGNAFRPL